MWTKRRIGGIKSLFFCTVSSDQVFPVAHGRQRCFLCRRLLEKKREILKCRGCDKREIQYFNRELFLYLLLSVTFILNHLKTIPLLCLKNWQNVKTLWDMKLLLKLRQTNSNILTYWVWFPWRIDAETNSVASVIYYFFVLLFFFYSTVTFIIERPTSRKHLIPEK